MANSRRLRPGLSLSLAVISISLACILAPTSARHGCRGFFTAFSFPDFSSHPQSLSLVQDARFSDSGVQISGSQPGSVGGFFHSKPVRFLPPFHFAHPVSFSSFFSFSMAAGGDGLAFVIMPRKDFKGANGQWLGLEPSSEIPPLAHTLAVEFDTAMNVEVADSSENHVGLDIESVVSLATANVSDGLSLNSGERLYAWIDYRAPLKLLEVRLSSSQSPRPETPILSHVIDLSSVLREEMFVGFVSSTGDKPQRHMIYTWSFSTSGPRMRPRWAGRPHSWHHGGWFGHGHGNGFGFGHDHGFGFGHGRPPHHDHYPHHGFPGNWHPQPRDFDHWHHQAAIHHEEDDSWEWLDDLSDVWRIIISLLFGIVCGATAAALIFVVWACIRRWCMKSEKEEDVGILYGYQKLTTAEEAPVKTDPNGYQQLETTEPEAKTQNAEM